MKTMRHIQTWLLITLLALSASNDVWGKRLETNWNGSEVSESQTQGNQRGYTDHEHLDSIGLIHMNGRVYDPKLARFISPDPYIQDPYNTQSFNRYSYVWNNPLRHTDPTGEFIPLIIAGIKIAGLAYGVYEAAEVARGIATGEITGQEAVTGAVITAGLNLVGGAAFKTVNKVTPPVVKEQIKDVVDKALRKNTDAQQNLSDSGTPLKKEQGGGDNNTVVASDVNDDASKGVKALPSLQVANAGGKIISEITKKDAVFFRVFSGNSTAGGFLTKVAPTSRNGAIEGLALPPGNTAEFIQRVLVPAGTRLQRSRALPAFGRRGGKEQFELLDQIPTQNFGPGVPFK